MDREESLTVKCSWLGPHSLFVIHFVCQVLTTDTSFNHRQIRQVLESQKGVSGLQSKESKMVAFCTTFFPTGLASQR